MIPYFKACATFSNLIARLMAKGLWLGIPTDHHDDDDHLSTHGIYYDSSPRIPHVLSSYELFSSLFTKEYEYRDDVIISF